MTHSMVQLHSPSTLSEVEVSTKYAQGHPEQAKRVEG